MSQKNKEESSQQSLAAKKAGVSISNRLYSLDALRGFDMLIIIGLDGFFHRLARASESPFWGMIAGQFDHPDWHGFTFYDLVFPLFLFIAGVATPYSIASRMKKGQTKPEVLRHIVQRGVILVILGILYSNRLEIQPISNIRFGTVLGRIGLAYMFANIIFLYARKTWQYIWLGILLIGYWLLMKLGSAPGFPMGDLSMEGNIVSWVDRTIMPGRLYKGIHDPEGLLGTIPAIGTGLLGIFTGNLLKNGTQTPVNKAKWIAVAGVVSILLAQLWNLNFPINKNLWTSSFVLHAAGISWLLLALFYYIIDVKGHRKWSFFLRVIGMNSILIYVSVKFIAWSYTNEAFFGWAGQLIGDTYGPVFLGASLIFVKWVFLYLCYKHKIFLKV